MSRAKFEEGSFSFPIRKERDSNMELMRIITMMMIMILHADFLSTGSPNSMDFITMPVVSLLKSGLESLTIIGVNVFVLLSGWYGIHPKRNRIIEFLFQILFFHLIGLAIAIVTQQDISIRNVLSVSASLWFVKAYLLLYILSPVLNAFSDKAERHSFKYVLIGFFIMQSLFGWLSQDDSMLFSRGYSTISFIGLYLLARYVRIYQPFYTSWTVRKYVYIYLLLSTIITLLFYISLLGIIPQFGDMYAYTSPLVIMSSLSFFLIFSKLSLRSRIVNSIGKSCFAVYLFHVNKYVLPYFISIMLTLYQTVTYPLYIFYSTVFCIIIYIIAILLDKVRFFIFTQVQKK